jgi:regulator of cell morphogenesis and NO signaling
MNATKNDTVRDLAVRIPGATRLFERAGIDYCCGGGRTLEAACDAAGLSSDSMLTGLEELGSECTATGTDPTNLSLTELARHIVQKHHTFAFDELRRLATLLAKVRSKHERNHPELADVAYAFDRLAVDLLPHMNREERVLFPYVAAMERAEAANERPSTPAFATIKNPVRVMSLEHDAAGETLAELRMATGGYAVPEDACLSFRALYEGLRDLEADLHEHIHLENNILFPRAVALEAKLA